MGITQQVLDDLARVGAAKETGGFKSASIGSVKIPKRLILVNDNPVRERIKRIAAMNSAKDIPTDKPGFQGLTVDTEYEVNDKTADDVGDWMAHSMGEEVTPVTLPAFSAGDEESVTVGSSTTFDDIIRVPCSDGLTRHMPVKTATATKATFAHRLPSGVTASAKPKNASETSTPTGRAFRDKPDGAVDSFQLLVDQSGYTGELPIKGQGCVLASSFRVIWTLNQLLKLGFSWQGAIWTILSAGASGLSDPVDVTETYISDVISLGIQSIGTPVVLTELVPKSLETSWGYGFLKGTGGQAPSAGVVPASNVTTYTRQKSGEQSFTVILETPDWQTWDTARKAETPYEWWQEQTPGNPTASVGLTRLIGWCPQVIPVEVGKTKVDGVLCTRIEFQIGRLAGKRRQYLSLFGQ